VDFKQSSMNGPPGGVSSGPINKIAILPACALMGADAPEQTKQAEQTCGVTLAGLAHEKQGKGAKTTGSETAELPIQAHLTQTGGPCQSIF
jgi:hypothetical protein